MKKILLGLVAAFALTTFAAPAFADDKPAADAGEKKPAKAKKGKKGKKAEGEKPAADAPAK